ncbi:MAG: TonB-dependent receptor, partial [Acidobacteria bacterium]|nr:TonB-dependent receptor [Acidobacteriota bacterium]
MYRWTWDYAISPRTLNHISAGWNDWWQMKASINYDKGWGAKLGIKNTPDPNKDFPGVNMDGYTGWGREEWGGSFNKAWAFSDDLTFVTGTHGLKFGFMYQRDHYNGYGQHTGTGGFDFGRTGTSVPEDQTNTSGNGFATFLLGYVTGARIQTLRFVSDQWHYYAGYAQDDWRVPRRLTLNLGILYEYTPPTTEGHFPDGYNNFDPTLPNPGAGGR